jgi:hypothetical protein
MGFHLILDGSHPYKSNKQGPEVPTVSTISDNRYATVDVLGPAGSTVVCKRLEAPHFTCGLEVVDDGVRWGVLFDRTDLPQAARMKAQATAAIASYRR